MQHAGLSGFLRISVAFISVGLLYFVGLRAAHQTSSKTAWMIVIGGTLAFIIMFLFMAPLDARDIYDNIFHGRILGVYRANPFRDLISSFPQDPFFKYPWWKNSPSAYGPLLGNSGRDHSLAGRGWNHYEHSGVQNPSGNISSHEYCSSQFLFCAAPSRNRRLLEHCCSAGILWCFTKRGETDTTTSP